MSAPRSARNAALHDDTRTISDVPSRSLLSRLTDHYMQIIANRAPVGFEAEFDNPRGETICYRGILMPFSSDGEQIDFIYGVINGSASTVLPSSRPGLSFRSWTLLRVRRSWNRPIYRLRWRLPAPKSRSS